MTDTTRETGPREPITVLSVMGAGRSGTTVLASILNEIDGFASAGELRWLWDRGVVQERPCGCGEVPARCPVWSPVVAHTVGSGGDRPPEEVVQEIVAAQREVSRGRNRWRVLGSAGGAHRDWAALQRVRAAMGAACVAFARTTGQRVVVDTSKRAEDAAVLAAVDGVDHYVLHIVRDPRAVVHSWRRAKTFTAGGSSRTMGTRGMPGTVRRWIENSLGAEVLLRQLPPTRWLRVRYEDFSRDPRGVVDQVLELLGAHGQAPFENDDTVLLHPNHIVAGNPSRFTTGSVRIRLDEEWRTGMRRRDQRLVALFTWPLMLRYGYLGSAQASCHRETVP